MPELSKDQLKEYEEWKATRSGKPISEEGLRGVIDDDVAQAKLSSNKKDEWSRDYNHAPESVGPRIVAEGEKQDV